MDKRGWVKHCMSVFLVLAFICSLALGIQALADEQNVKSGIVTLQFQLSSLLDDNFLAKRTPQEPDLIDAIQTVFNEAPGAISHIETAISAAATSIPDIIKDIPDQVDSVPDLLEDVRKLAALFPKNCSVGTGKFCVGLSSNISCNSLPLNITEIIPSDILRRLSEKLDTNPLDKALAKTTAPYLRDTIIIGIVLTFIAAFAFIISLYSAGSYIGRKIVQPGALYATARLVLGLVLNIPFLIPTIILHVLRTKLEQLPSWIQVQQGDVYGLSLGCLGCSLLMVMIGTITPLIL